jgi:hypothetical protein
MPGFRVAKSPQDRAIRRQPRPNIFGNAKPAAVFWMRDLTHGPGREDPPARPRLSCRNDI